MRTCKIFELKDLETLNYDALKEAVDAAALATKNCGIDLYVDFSESELCCIGRITIYKITKEDLCLSQKEFEDGKWEGCYDILCQDNLSYVGKNREVEYFTSHFAECFETWENLVDYLSHLPADENSKDSDEEYSDDYFGRHKEWSFMEEVFS